MSSLQTIFFKPSRGFRQYSDESYGYDIPYDILYQLDGVISEQHSSSVKVTKNPVEYGVDISDHAIKQPMKVVVNGIVTNSPSIAQLAQVLPGGDSAISEITSIITGSRARAAYKGLIEIQNLLEPLQLQTGFLVYDNMVLTNVSAPNNIQSNLRVQLTFEEVFIADGYSTGVTQAVTTTPTDVDIITAQTALLGLGLSIAS